MNKIKIYSVVSIDGFSCPPDGSMDWIAEAGIPRGVDLGIHAFYEGISTVAMTLGHYLSLLGCELLGPHMEKPCLLIRPRQELEITSAHPVEYVTDADHGFPAAVKRLRELKTSGPGDIWVAGDDKLLCALFKAEIIDEVILTMIPVSLGKGIKIFPADFNEKKWKARNVEVNDRSGISQIHYQYREDSETQLMN